MKVITVEPYAFGLFTAILVFIGVILIASRLLYLGLKKIKQKTANLIITVNTNNITATFSLS